MPLRPLGAVALRPVRSAFRASRQRRASSAGEDSRAVLTHVPSSATATVGASSFILSTESSPAAKASPISRSSRAAWPAATSALAL